MNTELCSPNSVRDWAAWSMAYGHSLAKCRGDGDLVATDAEGQPQIVIDRVVNMIEDAKQCADEHWPEFGMLVDHFATSDIMPPAFRTSEPPPREPEDIESLFSTAQWQPATQE